MGNCVGCIGGGGGVVGAALGTYGEVRGREWCVCTYGGHAGGMCVVGGRLWGLRAWRGNGGGRTEGKRGGGGTPENGEEEEGLGGWGHGTGGGDHSGAIRGGKVSLGAVR